MSIPIAFFTAILFHFPNVDYFVETMHCLAIFFVEKIEVFKIFKYSLRYIRYS